MSPRYQFKLAGPDDDSALRSVLRRTAMAGTVSLSFQREPSFFAAEQIGSLDSQVIAVQDVGSNAIVGLGCRSFRKMFIDGKVEVGGYLSSLRGLPEVRRGTLLARGYHFLKDLHADGRVPYYVTSIFDDNQYASELLTSRRAGLPVYHPLGRLNTYLIPLYGLRRQPRPSEEVIRGASGDLLRAAVERINSYNQGHQFAPWYSSEHFQAVSHMLPGFCSENLFCYRDDGGVTATLGVWDQTSFKQSVVTGYSWRYRLASPVCAAGAWLGLAPRLPEIGGSFPYLYAAFLSHLPGCLPHLEALLLTALRDWSRKGYGYLMAGCHDASPVNELLQRYSVSRKSSSLYLVYWEDMLDSPLPSFDPIPHLEIATL